MIFLVGIAAISIFAFIWFICFLGTQDKRAAFRYTIIAVLTLTVVAFVWYGIFGMPPV